MRLNSCFGEMATIDHPEPLLRGWMKGGDGTGSTAKLPSTAMRLVGGERASGFGLGKSGPS